MTLKLGDRLGDYRIERVLDGGGRWQLCAAAHVLLPRTVTIRVARTPEEGVRLLREACIVEALAHAGIPRLYECGLYAVRQPWIATEPVAGRSLADLIAEEPLAPGAVAAVIRDVAGVLAHAHRRGIVHHALGPDAIVLGVATTERGWPICLFDWSEARTLDAPPAPPRFGPYDAPELTGERAIDATVDVYALGAIGFEALTGALPFHSDAPRASIGDEILHRLGRRGAVPAAAEILARLIERMLADTPAARPDAAEVGRIAAQVAAELEHERSESAALARALLAVEEISLTVDDDPDEPEIEVTVHDSGAGLPVVARDRDGVRTLDDLGADAAAALAALEGLDPVAITTRPTLEIPAVIPPAGSPVARIRRPRWTPSFARIDSEHTSQVAGEITIERGEHVEREREPS